MSESPEDDTASKAIERGKTSASQTFWETDGGQEQVQKWGKDVRQHKGVGEEEMGKANTQKEALHIAPR